VRDQHPIQSRHFEFGESADGPVYLRGMAEHVFPQVLALVLGHSLEILQVFCVWDINDMVAAVILQQLLIIGEQNVRHHLHPLDRRNYIDQVKVDVELVDSLFEFEIIVVYRSTIFICSITSAF